MYIQFILNSYRILWKNLLKLADLWNSWFIAYLNSLLLRLFRLKNFRFFWFSTFYISNFSKVKSLSKKMFWCQWSNESNFMRTMSKRISYLSLWRKKVANFLALQWMLLRNGCFKSERADSKISKWSQVSVFFTRFLNNIQYW